ncbi:unnamed protein product [Linum tenue]|uniref:Tower domain-containing protein n=1 Tax=Linum tenue TaxID=586396 RepID=A0AAV0KPL8_9ROSI|nr:unnamed protein product [Linum tenue]
MSTWRIFSDAENDFRWEVSGAVAQSNLPVESKVYPVSPVSSSFRLPSMADLLLEGCPKLLENAKDGGGSAPIFRTGSGKSVALKQSSIAKALSVLSDGDGLGTAGYAGEAYNGDVPSNFSNSLFQTASGKSVGFTSAGLSKARSLLGMTEDGGNASSFEGFQRPQRSSFAKVHTGGQGFTHLGMRDGASKEMPGSSPATPYKTGLAGSRLSNEFTPDSLLSKVHDTAAKPPPIKFQTAGGRSLSVSTDALQRARSLLGDPDLGSFFNVGDPAIAVSEERRTSDSSFSKVKDVYAGFTYPGAARSKYTQKNFLPPLKASSNQFQGLLNSENVSIGSNLLKQFDAVGNDCINGNVNKENSLASYKTCMDDHARLNTIGNGSALRRIQVAKPCPGPLADISNTVHTNCADGRQVGGGKRRLRGGISVSPFKRPRNSKFITPLNKNHCPSGLSVVSSQIPCSRKRVSTRYPAQTSRMHIKEYFGVALPHHRELEEQAACITSDAASTYSFPDQLGTNSIGVEACRRMLVQSGASEQCASEEWVTNHYKWIVWKLGCYDRYRPVKAAAKFLTITNVLEELKYRYEREVNHGHRSALKRILEGDVPPSSMMVLCISAVCANSEAEAEDRPPESNSPLGGTAAKVQLTDGWYAVDALLDMPLSKLLSSGNLFVGQKLRVWGAGLSGWAGPVSPLEASNAVSLLLHTNGTYRAHWADRLGFCKRTGAPLAFRCIKSNGGPVPHTLVGVRRIYPVLYKEKFGGGGSIVRSERMEAKMLQVYNDRRSVVVEGVVLDMQRGTESSRPYNNDSDSEEGAKLLKILETSAEPEVLMAGMSSAQLASFTSYQAKLQATKQFNMDKAIEKAFRDAGLEERDVTPFMRVRVVGLTTGGQGNIRSQEGLITIWNPTEKQQLELVEGQAYDVAGLVPVNCDSNTLYLQARGPGNKWKPLSRSQTQSFEPFFTPRMSITLSNLGEVAFGSEFDMAAVVVHVGEVYKTGVASKQWVFVTDNSISTLNPEAANSILALSFGSPREDKDSAAPPVNHNLAGSTVGFCNIIKRKKDQMNELWIAEATENSTYYLTFDSRNCSHLKKTAASVQSWAKVSRSVISRLKEKVLNIVDAS